MGESRASGENTLVSDFTGEGANCIKDDFPPNRQNIAYLRSFSADKLKYVHTQPFGYNKCKFSSTIEAALVIKAKDGREQA